MKSIKVIRNQINFINNNKSLCFYSNYSTQHQKDLMARSLPKKKPINGVEKIICIASGKGGVGKSTTSVNLAVTLSQMGKRVGLLDADVFGPSIPRMLNIKETPLINKQNLMIPPINYGIKCISMGLLIDKNKPVIWRGPLVMSAIQRLLLGTEWAPLDLLIIDTPPGTGDIHLSLAQHIPIDGVILISTPQTVALDVTERGAEMYKTLKIPIIGLIENMSTIQCTNCNAKIQLYDNVTEKYIKSMGIPLLQQLPIIPQMAECCDNGIPLVIKLSDEKDSEFIAGYMNIADIILKKLF